GNLDTVTLAKLHDDVQKVHAVELHLLAEANFVLQLREILVGSDVGEDIENFEFDFVASHFSSYRLTAKDAKDAKGNSDSPRRHDEHNEEKCKWSFVVPVVPSSFSSLALYFLGALGVLGG